MDVATQNDYPDRSEHHENSLHTEQLSRRMPSERCPFSPPRALFSLRSAPRKKGGSMWKNFVFLQEQHLDSRGGFVLEQNTSREAFVSPLFVEVELS